MLLLLDEDFKCLDKENDLSTHESNELNVSTRDEFIVPITKSEQEGFYQNQLSQKSRDLKSKHMSRRGRFNSYFKTKQKPYSEISDLVFRKSHLNVYLLICFETIHFFDFDIRIYTNYESLQLAVLCKPNNLSMIHSIFQNSTS